MRTNKKSKHSNLRVTRMRFYATPLRYEYTYIPRTGLQITVGHIIGQWPNKIFLCPIKLQPWSDILSGQFFVQHLTISFTNITRLSYTLLFRMQWCLYVRPNFPFVRPKWCFSQTFVLSR